MRGMPTRIRAILYLVELISYAPARVTMAAGVRVLAKATKRSNGLGSLSDVVLVVQASLVCASQ